MTSASPPLVPPTGANFEKNDALKRDWGAQASLYLRSLNIEKMLLRME
jgi:hypothetical protein